MNDASGEPSTAGDGGPSAESKGEVAFASMGPDGERSRRRSERRGNPAERAYDGGSNEDR